jgi:hypothetical protein
MRQASGVTEASQLRRLRRGAFASWRAARAARARLRCQRGGGGVLLEHNVAEVEETAHAQNCPSQRRAALLRGAHAAQQRTHPSMGVMPTNQCEMASPAGTAPALGAPESASPAPALAAAPAPPTHVAACDAPGAASRAQASSAGSTSDGSGGEGSGGGGTAGAAGGGALLRRGARVRVPAAPRACDGAGVRVAGVATRRRGASAERRSQRCAPAGSGSSVAAEQPGTHGAMRPASTPRGLAALTPSPLASPSRAHAYQHPFTCAARTAPSARARCAWPRSGRTFYRRLRARRAACRAVCTPDPHAAPLRRRCLQPSSRRPGMRAGGGAYAPRRRRDAAAALSAWWAVALFACRWRGAAAKIDTTTETEVFLKTLEDPLAICNDGSPGAPVGTAVARAAARRC